jgi:ABC-type branched-subunit amino acid transport system permease subunit
LFGHIEPEQFDLTLSLMVLAAVVIGGRWGIVGVVLGALTVAAYDRLLVEAVNGAVHGLGAMMNVPGLLSTDLRGDNFAVFGFALYLATLLRAGSSRA